MSAINRVKLYSCGGAGCGIGKTMEAFREENTIGFSNLDITYIDTSGSDLYGVEEQYIYRFKGKNGSGGLRKENAAAITTHAQEILQKHPPQFLNIVISSAGGGKRL